MENALSALVNLKFYKFLKTILEASAWVALFLHNMQSSSYGYLAVYSVFHIEL